MSSSDSSRESSSPPAPAAAAASSSSHVVEEVEDEEEDYASSRFRKKARRSSSSLAVKDAGGVIDLVDSDQEVENSGEEGFVEWGDNDWEGPAREKPDAIMYAVIRACPRAGEYGAFRPADSHVKVLAVFQTRAMAEERADGVRARLDVGGISDGMVPGGTSFEDEVQVWIQEVKVFHD